MTDMHSSMSEQLCRRCADLEDAVAKLQSDLADLREQNAKFKSALEQLKPGNPENGELR